VCGINAYQDGTAPIAPRMIVLLSGKPFVNALKNAVNISTLQPFQGVPAVTTESIFSFASSEKFMQY
jgi:hypothetical protein